jgi:glucose/mannose-6-phosphate isomerase
MITEEYPRMIEEAIEASKNIDLPKFDFDNIVFCGIGGSLIVGNFIKDLLKYDCKKSIEVFGDYKLPGIVDEKSLVFFISYSGNTEEPLNQFIQALDRKCKIIGVTSGGKMEEWFSKLKIPIIKAPKGYSPRYAALSMFIPIIMYFHKIGLKDFENDIEECKNVLKKINVDELDKIANNINNCDLAIYGPNDFESIVRRFKNDFNENSKLLVTFDTFPEMNHNDIDGFENPELNKNRAVLLIRDKDESFEMRNRIEITKDVIRKNVKSIHDIWTTGESKLAKIVSLIFIGSYISCKLAELNGIDAEKIEFIDRLKKELKEKTNLVEKLGNSIGF